MSALPLQQEADAYDRSMAGRILLVEDDEQIGRGLAQVLRAQPHDVTWVTTAADALAADAGSSFDLVLLDLGLPDADGIEVCRALRARTPDATIVVLTARSAEMDVVVGLDAGADDYVTKPFRVAELAARVRAHLRRREPSPGASDRQQAGPIELDRPGRRAYRDGTEVALRAKEFDLLALLLAEIGAVVTRERIMDDVWDEHWFGSTKTLDMHISALRRKLDDPDGPSIITTVRGVGYRFERR